MRSFLANCPLNDQEHCLIIRTLWRRGFWLICLPLRTFLPYAPDRAAMARTSRLPAWWCSSGGSTANLPNNGLPSRVNRLHLAFEFPLFFLAQLPAVDDPPGRRAALFLHAARSRRSSPFSTGFPAPEPRVSDAHLFWCILQCLFHTCPWRVPECPHLEATELLGTNPGKFFGVRFNEATRMTELGIRLVPP